MTLNVAMGVTVFLVGMTLMASIALNLHARHLLKQCREMLDFCIELADEKEERKELERIGREGTE